ncbi:MAG TPA: pirin family protein [Usitatibacter sp.]|nr:pirin family protein [Usitatibacter sp.]
MTAAVIDRSAARPVERVVASQIAPVGTFTVRRALPDRHRHSVGPWVFLDHFGPFRVKPGNDGVGPHPHAGIETVTYLLSGRQQHRDSAGHTGIVSAGGAQWMTAGRGIIHAETPLPLTEEEHTLHGIQLWTSLPRRLKNGAPRYQNLTADTVAVARRPGVTVRVVGGELAGVTGPGETHMPLVVAHVTLDPAATFSEQVPEGFEMAAYVIAGHGAFGGATSPAAAHVGELVLFAGNTGAVRFANASDQSLEVLLIGGTPAEGPLVFHGPFVMNDVDQVRAAEIAYRSGRMGTLEP